MGAPRWPPNPPMLGPPRRSRDGPRHRVVRCGASCYVAIPFGIPLFGYSLFVGQRGLQPFDALEPVLAAELGGLPASPLGLCPRRERAARLRPQVRTQVHVGEVGGAGVADLAR